MVASPSSRQHGSSFTPKATGDIHVPCPQVHRKERKLSAGTSTAPCDTWGIQRRSTNICMQFRIVRLLKQIRLEKRMEATRHLPAPPTRLLPMRRGKMQRGVSQKYCSIPIQISHTHTRATKQLQPQRPLHSTPTTNARTMASRNTTYTQRSRTCRLRIRS